MKYIKKIILENFQSHKYSEIVLEDGLNIIVGPSDSGKTAILRAIKWALYNEPAGDFFIREGSNEVSVTIHFSDNSQLVRFRSRSKNIYKLIYNNGEELRLEGFGTGVPEEIREAIGIYKINLGGNETSSVSLAEQLEGPFLLSEKSSTRASAIGQLVGVDIIDEALREVLKDTRALNINKKSLEENIDNFTEEIKTYDYLTDLKSDINIVSEIRQKLFDTDNLISILKNNHASLLKLHDEMDKLKIIKDDLSRIDDVDKILIDLQDSYIRHWRLGNFYKNLSRVNIGISENKKIVDELNDIDCSINIKNKLSLNIADYKRLQNLSKEYSEVKKEREFWKENINILSRHHEYEDKIIKIEENYMRMIKLVNIRDRYYKVKSILIKGQKYIDDFKFLEEIMDISKKLESHLIILTKLNKLSSNLVTIQKDIASELKSIEEINSKNEELIHKYKYILNKIEKCPLCFSEIDDNKIEHIVQHYVGG